MTDEFPYEDPLEELFRLSPSEDADTPEVPDERTVVVQLQVGAKTYAAIVLLPAGFPERFADGPGATISWGNQMGRLVSASFINHFYPEEEL